jgi:hypothetical protein
MSATDFVTDLYNNAPHRVPDSGGLTYWVGQQQPGVSEASVVQTFADSLECRADTAGVTHANWYSYPANP